MNEAEVKELMTKLDKDGDGSINFEEFYSWWSDNERGHYDKAGILKLKLQSKEYLRSVKSAQGSLTQSRSRLQPKFDASSNDLKFEFEAQVGDFKKETESIKISSQRSNELAAKFRSTHEFQDEATAFVVILETLPEAAEETFSALQPLIEELTAEIGVQASLKFSENDGKKFLTLRATVPPEIAAMGMGILETANLSLLDIQILGDQVNQAFHILVRAALSRNIIELGHEMGALDDILVKVVDMYISSRTKIVLRSPQQIEHPLVQQAFQIAAADRTKASVIAKKKLFKELPEEVQALWPVAMQLSTLKEATAVVGNYLFSIHVNLPGFIQNFKFEMDKDGSGSGSD